MNQVTESFAEVLREHGYTCVHKDDGDRNGELITRLHEDGWCVVDMANPKKNPAGQALPPEEALLNLIREYPLVLPVALNQCSAEEMKNIVARLAGEAKTRRHVALELWVALAPVFREHGIVTQELNTLAGTLEDMARRLRETCA